VARGNQSRSPVEHFSSTQPYAVLALSARFGAGAIWRAANDQKRSPQLRDPTAGALKAPLA
jgi:hypothetical protein